MEDKAELQPSWATGVEEVEFTEPFTDVLRRWLLGSAYALQPRRVHLMPAIVAMTIAHAFKSPASRARLPSRTEPVGKEGLVGICANLTPTSILDAYRHGLIPICHVGPMKWWRPAERAVLFLEEAHVETKVKKLLRKGVYRTTFDMDFAAVMRGCAEPRPGKVPLTWITPTMMRAFWDLHQIGYAHSIEVWNDAGDLVGGIYGLALGRIFFGESQFSTARDASKIASATLNDRLTKWGFILRDAKWITPYHAQGGFRTIPRAEFEELVSRYAQPPDRRGDWGEARTEAASSVSRTE